MLGSTFNTMTSELESQRRCADRRQLTLDERRRFIEAVLSGVTAGVIGSDPDGTVTLIDRSAEDLLDVRQDLTGRAARAMPFLNSAR